MYTQKQKLLLALTAACAAMGIVYWAARPQAALIAGLVSAVAELVTLASIAFESEDRKLEAWADDLAAQVVRAWSHRRDVLLGGRGNLVTRFKREKRLEAGTEGLSLDGGDWSDIHEVFLSLPSRKLVILGERGSGKTLITLQLVTSLLERRNSQDKAHEKAMQFFSWLVRFFGISSSIPDTASTELRGIPVPISVVGWDSKNQSLRDWLVSRLRTAYNMPRRKARALVDHGYILPVLDGFDEATSSRTSRRSALRILYRLNTDYGAKDQSGLRPLVLTCRTEDYEELPDPKGDPLLSRRVLGAAAVSMQSLTETEVINFLTSQAEAVSQRVGELERYLVGGDNQLVVAAMRNPLVIALATQSAMSGSIDYRHLAALGSEEAVRRYFIASFVRSTVVIYPKAFGKRVSISEREKSLDVGQESGRYHYNVLKTQEWLFYIAEYLKISSERSAELVQPEFAPQDLWMVAALHKRPVLRTHRLLAIIATIIVGSFGAEIAGGRAGVACWIGATALAALFAARISRARTPGLSRVDFRQIVQGTTAVYLLPAVTIAGCLTGLLAYKISKDVAVGVTEGIAGATFGALLAGLSRGLARAVEPLDALKNDLRFGIAVGIVGAIAIGLPGGLTGGLWSDLHLNPALTKPGSAALAVVLAVPCGVVLGSGVWVRFQIAALLSRHELMPRSAISFLRWTEATGLLRTVGTNYQFRHEELRDWLLSDASPANHSEHQES